MAVVTITIDTSNAAFEDYDVEEVARILKEARRRLIDNGPDDFPLLDANGNKVGRFEWSEG